MIAFLAGFIVGGAVVGYLGYRYGSKVQAAAVTLKKDL